MSFAAAQATYVLHSRPYKETSALVDFFTPLGRLRAVLRGARGKAGALARPFVPLEAEWRGRGELKTVARLESAGVPNLLNGQALFSGLYLNELLIRLLPAEDPQPEIFAHYAATLPLLAAGRHRTAAARVRMAPAGATGLWFRSRCRHRWAPDRAAGVVPAFARGRPGAGGATATRAVPGLRTVIHGRRRLERPRRPGGGQAPDAPGARSHLGGRPLVSRELFMNRKESPRD
ncbi:DNA repair protein RecO [Pseudomonas aeruginosa]